MAVATVVPAQPSVAPPPNAPATVVWDAAQGKLSLRYHGGVIMDAMVRAVDASGNAVAGTALQVFAIREARPYPWVLSTTRHLSQGGVSLLDVKWDKSSNMLAGASAVVSGDPYALTVHLPAGFKLASAEVDGGKAEIANQQETATVRVVPPATRTVGWKMKFTK